MRSRNGKVYREHVVPLIADRNHRLGYTFLSNMIEETEHCFCDAGPMVSDGYGRNVLLSAEVLKVRLWDGRKHLIEDGQRSSRNISRQRFTMLRLTDF